MSIRSVILLTATLVATAVPLAAQESRLHVIEHPPTIGVQVATGPPPVVHGVFPDSPADRAGIREGDVITKVNGGDATFEVLREAARDDERLRLEIRRGGEELAVEVVPSREGRYRRLVFRADSIGELAEKYLEHARDAAEAFEDFDFDLVIPEGLDSLAFHRFRFDSLPDLPDGPRFRIEGPDRIVVMKRFFGSGVEGTRLAELNEGLAAHFAGADEGALVLEVEPDSRADRAGLEAGDVIVEANGRSVYSPASLRVAIAETDREEITLAIVRYGARRTIRLPRPPH